MKKFTESHEWIEMNDDIGTVGVTQFAQAELGDIVYVELPEVGRQVKAGDEAAVLESTKAAADVYSPVSGIIVEVNDTLTDASNMVNESPEVKGWIFKVQMSKLEELDKLIEEKQYRSQVKG